MKMIELKAAYTAARDADETYRAALCMALNDFNAKLDKAEGMRGDVAYALKARAGEALAQAEYQAHVEFASRYSKTDTSQAAWQEGIASSRAARLDKGKAILAQALAARAQALEAARNKRKETA